MSKLGQRIRTSRWKENRKSQREDSIDHEQPAQKKFKLGSKQRETSKPSISSEDFDSHVQEMKKEWDGKRTVSHIRVLLSQTRTSRTQWQSTLSPGKFEPILEKFPCFEEGSFVSYILHYMEICGSFMAKVYFDIFMVLLTIFTLVYSQIPCTSIVPTLNVQTEFSSIKHIHVYINSIIGDG